VVPLLLLVAGEATSLLLLTGETCIGVPCIGGPCIGVPCIEEAQPNAEPQDERPADACESCDARLWGARPASRPCARPGPGPRARLDKASAWLQGERPAGEPSAFQPSP
jgi:hypothetical protein